MNDTRTAEDASRTLLVGVSLWAAAVGGAWASDVFVKLAPGEVVALAAFATAFALATYALDVDVRRAVQGSRALLSIALGLDALLVAAAATLDISVAHPAFAPLAIFCVPLALVVHAALFARRESVTSTGRKSPGATRAAI